MAGMGMIKQNNARKAEKALNEILDKADSNANGRVELKDFMDILEANGVEVRKNKRICSNYSVPVHLSNSRTEKRYNVIFQIERPYLLLSQSQRQFI